MKIRTQSSAPLVLEFEFNHIETDIIANPARGVRPLDFYMEGVFHGTSPGLALYNSIIERIISEVQHNLEGESQ